MGWSIGSSRNSGAFIAHAIHKEFRRSLCLKQRVTSQRRRLTARAHRPVATYRIRPRPARGFDFENVNSYAFAPVFIGFATHGLSLCRGGLTRSDSLLMFLSGTSGAVMLPI
jgi:hypothetical protein